MRRLKWLQIYVWLVLFLLIPNNEIMASESQRYIIGFNEQIHEALLEPYEERIYQRLDEIHAVAIELTQEEADQFAHSPRVRFIEEDASVQAFNQQIDWGVRKGQAPAVWANGLAGKGIKIAILDTGVDSTHPDLTIEKGRSFVNYTSSYIDDNGHGTHVAGIIAARNNNIGTVGIAHEASLYAAKVLNKKGEGYVSDVIKGITWSLEEKVDLINLSLGMDKPNEALRLALDDAYQRGVLIIAAAGNSGNAVEYPAVYETVIAVAAVDPQDRRASFSAMGPSVEVAAPGVMIRSTHLNHSYKQENGTSMAAPHVTGHLALLKQAYPQKTHIEIRRMLHQQTVDLGPQGRDSQFGFGRILLPTSLKLEAARPNRPENLAVKVVGFEGNQSKVSITWKAATDGEKAKSYSIYRNNSKIGEVNSPTATFQDQVPEGTYSYSVTAVSEENKESDKSTAVTVIVKKDEESSITPSLEDVSGDEWYGAAVYELVERNIITGYPDGTFRPGQTITREEAAIMMTRALKRQPVSYTATFKDVRLQSSAAPFIQAMLNDQIFGGYPDNTFRPHVNIPRGEVAVILTRAYRMPAKQQVTFSDLNPDYFGTPAILAVAAADVAKGLPDGTFQPNKSVTRAEFAQFLSRALDVQ